MVNITRDFVTLMKCRYARNFSNRQQVKRVHLEKAAVSASISEAAQEVYLLLLLCVEAVVVSSNRPTVVVAVNNEVESKSQRFCERCTQTYRADFFASFGGALLALVYCTWQQDCLHHGGALVANFTQQSLLLLCRQRSALQFTGTYRFFAKFCKQYYSCLLRQFCFFNFDTRTRTTTIAFKQIIEEKENTMELQPTFFSNFILHLDS